MNRHAVQLIKMCIRDSFQVYAAKVRKLLTDLLHGHETENAKSHPMLVSRPVNKTAYIVITSDRGLVGRCV